MLGLNQECQAELYPIIIIISVDSQGFSNWHDWNLSLVDTETRHQLQRFSIEEVTYQPFPMIRSLSNLRTTASTCFIFTTRLLMFFLIFLVNNDLVHVYFQSNYPEDTHTDYLILAFIYYLYLFSLTAVTSLGMSVTYPIPLNHFMYFSHLWLRLDFVGIFVLTLGDFVFGIDMAVYRELICKRSTRS